jgi:hypothetical protein
VKALDPDVIAKLDRLLQRQREYVPLELLLAEGRLLYSDYDDWRNGTLAHLDERLFGEPESVIALLQSAAQVAKALKLIKQPLDYRGWGGGGALKFSRNPQLNALFHAAFKRAVDIHQPDLFMDNPASILINEVIAALTSRNYPECRKLLDQLIASDPAHQHIDAFLCLLETAQQPPSAPDPAWLVQLNQTVAPLAHERLGGRADDYLVPLWRHAADMLEGRPFNPLAPQEHSAYYWQQSADWQCLLSSTEAVDAWRCQADLLMYHAKACAQLHRQTDAMLDLFCISWHFPQQINRCIAQVDNLFKHSWQLFCDLDSDLTDSDFPAWLLISLPAESEKLFETHLAELQPAAGFLALFRLVLAERSKLAVGLRTALKQVRPDLLRCYLAHRG